MRAGEEFSELADLGGYGGRGWSSRSSRSTARIPAEAEDALGPNGSPRGHARSRSGLYYSPPGTSYTIVERPSSAMYHHRDREYASTGSQQYNNPGPRGTYLGSNPNFRSTPSNNKKRPISPEQVLRLFNNQSNSKLNVERPRRSPASSPPSTTHNYRVPYGPTVHELSTRTVTMVREPTDAHGFGICVKGGKDAGVGVYISRVEEGSVAERAGLRPGDSILEVNGTPFTGVSHEDALKMLKSCRKLSMTVKSPTVPGGPGFGGASWHLRQTCSWMDRQGRPVSPPLEYSRTGVVPPQRYGYGRASSKDRNVRRVDLCIEPGQSLGLMIRGGVEYNLGIFVTGVDKDSVADRAGLMVGDQILEVNGQSFMDVTHDEAVSQLKYHKRMSLLVRDVGKVPHSCTAYDRDWDLCSPGSRAAQTTRKWAAALQMVEEKARCILSKPEFTTLCYYTDEYSARHMTIDAFVQFMTELLNTPEKYTLMIELREIVAVEDRARFDELVYRREMDPLRGRDPREHDYRHSRRKGGVPDSNHSIMMSGGYQEEVGSEPVYSTYNEEEYRSPSEDSGVGMGIADRAQRTRPTVNSGKVITTEDHQNQEYCSGDEDNPPGTRSRRHSSPGESRTGSATALHQPDYPDSDQSGYLGGLRSSLGGWTQKVKSWYWGRPLELAHKLSRSFDMKDDQALLEGEGGLRRHQSMQRLARGDTGIQDSPRVVPDSEGNLRVTVRKTKPILGIAIEGGANTKHPLPRIININENGAAYCAGGLEVGQLILQVDGNSVEGLQHQDVARLIAESFARRDREDIEFLVIEAKKSNMEPKPTALIFLEA
ncbi:PREDICTED: whirlin isoform X2 [Nicrophorus vespilloides]|uniref:Whirlin isoform X2 n=1 Tax=Nicrophorus vespilloides TaxID=110193 RepID=A0ABM1MEP2_NICVS|nr:PREDICTED: whirlin isoform X2 [Nicrophorus vespilloides]